MKNILKKLLYAFVSLSLIVLLYLMYVYYDIDGKTDKLINYQPRLSTQIYDTNNLLIANIFEKEHRLYVKFDDIPAQLIEALLAIEDTSFYEHPGVNIDGIFRALIKNIKAGAKVEGASTLTQQLIRTALELTREKTYTRKIKEILLSLKLEQELSKDEILERYVNHIYLGHGYYGFRTASLGYFHKELSELTLKETAMLVSLPRSPNHYNPTKHLNYSLSRANTVISRMHDIGWCEELAFRHGINETPEVFNDTLTKNRAPYIVDEVIKRASKNIDNFKSGGYIIYTTIDLEIQELARESLKYSYDLIKSRDKEDIHSSTLNGAMVVTEPQTGSILALVGGVDYATSSYNRATMASRQVGSSIKPFIYSHALNLGYHPKSLVPDISRTYEIANSEVGSTQKKYWKPQNYGKNFKGFLTLEDALIKSKNLATINLVSEIGLQSVRNYLTKIGFTNIPDNLSISLGSFSASVLNVSKFYSLFSNYGTIVEPILIKSIKNRDGKKYDFIPNEYKIMEPEQSFLVLDMMRKIVTRGTGRGAKLKQIESAGKTGTTNENKDGWFCGFTPTLQIITWFGNDDNTPMNVRETGGRVGTPAYRHFVTTMIKRHPYIKRTFHIPQNIRKIKVKDEDIFFTPTSQIPSSSSRVSIDDEINF